MLRAAVYLAAAALTVSAQAPKKKAAARTPAPSAVAETLTVERVVVKGNKQLTAAQVEAQAALPVHQPLTGKDFEAARDRLLATGYFETVGYRYAPMSGTSRLYEATFEVVEITAVFPVQFENMPVPVKDIEADLKAHNLFYGPKLPGTQQVLGQYTRQVEQALAARNHPVRVLGGLVPVDKDEFKIVFRPDEPLPPVALVKFTGNKAITATVLQNAINDVAFGVPFTRDSFRQLLEHQIRPLYEAKGYLRAAFPMFTTEPAPKVKGLAVHVTVEEGAVYTLTKISLAGADPDYMDFVKIKTGGAADFNALEEALDRVKTQMKRSGYLEAKGTVERAVDDKARTAEVVLQMTPGPQYTMGKLTITGLDLNSEPVIRKLWITEPGKPFNALYPDYFLKRVREDGLFDGLGSTKAATEIDSSTHVVDVTLAFGASPKPKPRKRPGALEEETAPPK